VPTGASTETLGFLTAVGAVTPPSNAKQARPRVRLRGFERSTTRIRNRGAWPTSMVISFELSRRARLILAVRGPGPTCKLAGSIGIAGNKGLNLFPFDGVIRNRPLPPGTYRITIRPKEGVQDLARTFVTIVAPGKPVKTRRPKCTDLTPLGHGLEASTLPPFAVGGLTGTLIATRGDESPDTDSVAAAGKNAPQRTSGASGTEDEDAGVGLPAIPPVPADELDRVLAILLTPILLALLLTLGVALVRRRRLRRWARW
jgi:hypothetical protein